MTIIVKALKMAVLWLERRFPSKLTTDEVMAKFHDYENRLLKLESEQQTTNLKIQKALIFNGIAEQLGING